MNATEEIELDTGETTIFLRQLGAGPPLLLLHGFPQTHLMWRDIVPRLADQERGHRIHCRYSYFGGLVVL